MSHPDQRCAHCGVRRSEHASWGEPPSGSCGRFEPRDGDEWCDERDDWCVNVRSEPCDGFACREEFDEDPDR